MKEYIEKRGDFIDWGVFQIDVGCSQDGRHDLSSVYEDALNAEIVADAFQIIREKDPLAFLLQYHNLNRKQIVFLPGLWILTIPFGIIQPSWLLRVFKYGYNVTFR